MKVPTIFNRYDYYLLLIVSSIAFGDFGGALQPIRLLAILLLPTFLKFLPKSYYLKGIKKYMKYFILFCLISLVWTSDFGNGCKEFIYFCVHFLIFLEILVFSKKANNPLYSISWGWTLTVFVLTLIGIWEFFTGNHLSTSVTTDMTVNMGGVIQSRMNANATFGNLNMFVTLLCFSFPWLFYIVSQSAQAKKRIVVALVSIMLSVLIILVNGSRGGLFCYGIFAAIYMFFMPRNKYTVSFSALTISAFCYFIIQYSSEIFLVLTMKNEGAGLASDDSRIEIWSCAAMALAQTLGIGTGVGSMAASLGRISNTIIPATHNMFVEIIMQFGLILSFVYIHFLWRLFKRGYHLKDKIRKMCVLMAMIAMPMYGIINSIYLTAPSLYVLIATIFIFVYYERIKYTD